MKIKRLTPTCAGKIVIGWQESAFGEIHEHTLQVLVFVHTSLATPFVCIAVYEF